MDTVLIAEDELLVRMGLVVSIPWEQMGMRVTGEASNGADAWAMYQKTEPDIVITDIRMPGMDGLSLIRAIRKRGRHCAVIVITCVEHFETLHEAFDLDIVAYLVKATMTQEDILAAIGKARDSLRDSPDRPTERIAPADSPALALLCSLMIDRTLSCDAFLKQFYALMGRPMPPCALLTARLSLKPLPDLTSVSFCNMLKERLAAYGVSWFLSGERTLCALSEAPFPHEADQALADLAGYARDSFDLDVRFALSDGLISPEKLPGFLDTASRFTSQERLQGDHVVRLDALGRVCSEEISAFFSLLRDNIWYFRQGLSVMACAERIACLAQSLGADWQTIKNAAFLLAQYLETTARGDLSAEQFERFAAQMNAAPSVNTLFESMRVQIVMPLLAKRVSGARREIIIAVSYMAQHLSDGLSLHDVAASVGLHPVYFSNLFKSEMGINYSDFVTKLQIEKSCALLKDINRSIQEISEACGFSDISYFSRKFKQETGVSPRQWRQQNE